MHKAGMESIEIKQLSDATKLKMVEFFLKTSIPRILVEKEGESSGTKKVSCS